MIARRRVAFLKLCTLLRTIEADPDNFDAVRGLNLGVLKEILRDESHVIRLRAVLKDLNRRLKTDRAAKAEALALRKQIERHERSVERHLDQLFIWRCLADGLAYAYIGSFNIKHAFFDTASTAPKPEAGFISGKTGLANELAMLLSAIDHRVPAVLSDITNIIRYGDICLLGGNDPYPMEVKSRRGLNQRGKRQAAKLAHLEGFLKNDYAAGFRGAPEVRRVPYGIPHRDCIADINACIQSARAHGWNAVCPERGLVYAAIFSGDPIDDLLGHLGMARPMIFILNSDKREKTWAPYLPFVNSIRALTDLYDFVVGNFTLVVIVDAAVICDRLVMPDWKVSLLDNSDHMILLEHAGSGAKVAISAQFVGRLGYEFMSLDWFVEHQRIEITELLANMIAARGAMVDLTFVDEMAKAFEAMPRAYVAGES
jgi:hypothetical protein